MGRITSERVKLKAKRTFFYLLDREFGHPRDEEEKAIDPLAGGILQQGYQCGMLWGASMAVGAEALRKMENPDQATGLAILATQQVMDSFVHRHKVSNVKTSPKLISRTRGALPNSCSAENL